MAKEEIQQAKGSRDEKISTLNWELREKAEELGRAKDEIKKRNRELQELKEVLQKRDEELRMQKEELERAKDRVQRRDKTIGKLEKQVAWHENGGTLVELENKLKRLAENNEPEESQLVVEVSAFSHWKGIEETLEDVESSFAAFADIQTTLANPSESNPIDFDELILQRNNARDLYLKQVENLLPFNGSTFVLRHLNSFLHLRFSADISTETLTVQVIGLTGSLEEENYSVLLLVDDQQSSTSILQSSSEILWNEIFSFQISRFFTVDPIEGKDILNGNLWKDQLERLDLQQLSNLPSFERFDSEKTLQESVKEAIDAHNDWKEGKSKTIERALKDLIDHLSCQPSSSVQIGENLSQLEKATDFELNSANRYPQVVLETAERLSTFIKEEKQRIDNRLKSVEEHKKRAQQLGESLTIDVDKEVGQVSNARRALVRKRREIRSVKTQIKDIEEDDEGDDNSDEENLSKKLGGLQLEYVTLTKKYERILSRAVALGCEHFPEIFSKHGIKPSAFIDSEMQVDHFQNYKQLPIGSNHALFYGELADEKFILKQYPLVNVTRRRLFDREVRILRSLNHPRVISLKYVIHEKSSNTALLVMPFYPFNLSEWMKQKKPNDLLLQNVWRGICHGLEHIHQMGIIHRDIKPENILITDDDQPVLSDFDVSTTAQQGTIATTTLSYAGTLLFMAPEVEEGQRATTASDMYSFGRLLKKTKSFHSPNEALDQLIQRLLRKEPKERPSPSQVLADPYFTKLMVADQLEILKKTEEFLQQQVALQKRESELEEERKKVEQDSEGVKKQKEELEKMKRETEGEKQKYETEKKKLLAEEQRVKKEWTKVQNEVEKNRQVEQSLSKKEKELSIASAATSLPFYWTFSNAPVHSSPHLIDVTAEMLTDIQRLVDDTCDSATLGQGRDVRTRMRYTRLQVVKVTRWEHPALWHQYSLRKTFISSHHNPLTESLTVKTQTDWMDSMGLAEGLNEAFLFHGTKEELIPVIRSQGFDERVGRLDGLYGSGIYFAEDSSKADQYATPNSSNSFFMFLSRVTLASPFHTQTSHNDRRRPPERQDKNCLFDSLVGKIPYMRYREFIVYDKSQCFPEFLIEYKRV